MSKITFRADDDLIQQLEEYDASKSEVMREALRTYLDAPSDTPASDDSVATDTESIDALIADRVDDIIADRLEGAFTPSQPQDINVNIALDGDHAARTATSAESSPASADGVSHDEAGRKTPADDGENTAEEERQTCSQCGENITPGHVYCPNCGEKASHRVFCECGDELRSDWAFCPSCGRRTPAADVLDQP